MEFWKPISGHPSYEASSEGNIRSIDRNVTRNGHVMRSKGKTLSPGTGVKGHKYVNLHTDGVVHTRYVHRLIALTFHGAPPPGKPLAAHDDGDPSNNRSTNVYWASHAENSADSIRHGTSSRPRGEKHFRAKLTPAVILEMKALVQDGISTRAVGRAYGVAHTTVSNALSGKSYQ